MKRIQIEGCEHYSVDETGNVFNTETNRKLKVDFNSCGYQRVTLWTKFQTRVRKTVHRIVAEAYLENNNLNFVVNHIDGNKLNNCVKNLEWISASDNAKHAFKLGLRVSPDNAGQIAPNRMFTTEFVSSVRSEIKSGLKRKEICKKLGLSITQYKNISRHYKEVT